MSDIQELAKYLRQYRHNDSDGFVFGYDKDGTDALVECLTAENDALREEVVQLKAQLEKMNDAATDVINSRSAVGLDSDRYSVDMGLLISLSHCRTNKLRQQAED